MFPLHRIALEPRSGIWLLFYETLFNSNQGLYKQQLLQIFGHRIKAKIRFMVAEKERNYKTSLKVR